MPTVVIDGKGVPAVRRERHLFFSRFSSVRRLLMEKSPDVSRGIVGRQVELDRNSLPQTIGVLENAIAGNVAR